MILGKIFERFAKQTPVTIMFRGVLEHALPASRIDELFREHAESQYEKELLFSTAVDVLALVVVGMRKSINASYDAQAEKITVSVRSLYGKLQKSEPIVAQALVRESAARLSPVIDRMAAAPSLLPGYRVKILDGKHLDATEHRLAETRNKCAAPLPGELLVVLDPQLSLATDVFPCEDAYTQERSLLPQVLETVTPGEAWIADSGFCTTKFLFGLSRRDAFFLIRQHGMSLVGRRLIGRRKKLGRIDTGVVYEQLIEIDDQTVGETLKLRRITLALDKPTRNDDHEIHLLSNLPSEITAQLLAERYLDRWKIENLFGELSQSFDAEIKTLCYPQAALLTYCIALFTYNAVSVLKSALHAAHGDRAELQRLSTYYLAEEISASYRGMMIAIPEEEWSKSFAGLTTSTMAKRLIQLARDVRIKQFQKTTRGKRKPPPTRTAPQERHVSTKRLLDQRRTKKPIR